jgi:hypothetical protein
MENHIWKDLTEIASEKEGLVNGLIEDTKSVDNAKTASDRSFVHGASRRAVFDH